jgi:hypothetical protein
MMTDHARLPIPAYRSTHLGDVPRYDHAIRAEGQTALLQAPGVPALDIAPRWAVYVRGERLPETYCCLLHAGEAIGTALSLLGRVN